MRFGKHSDSVLQLGMYSGAGRPVALFSAPRCAFIASCDALHFFSTGVPLCR